MTFNRITFCLIILAWFSFVPSFSLCAQTAASETPEIYILPDSLLTKGFINLTLQGTWKYKAGDDLSWASPSYDDSNWNSYPSPDRIPDSLTSPIGWLRFQFEADSSLTQQTLFLNYQSLGTSRVFFNGVELNGFGPSAFDSKFQKTYRWLKHLDSFSPLNLSHNTHNVIAIRYSKEEFFFHSLWNPQLKLYPIGILTGVVTIDGFRKASRNRELDIQPSSMAMVVLLLVFTLHVSLFVKFKQEKGNFWIALLTGTLLLLSLYVWVDSLGFLPVTLFGFLMFSFPMLVNLPIALIPPTLGRVLDVRFNRAWLFTPLPILLVFPFIPIDYIIQSVFFTVTLSTVGAVYLFIQAKKEHKRDARLLVVTLFSYPLLYLSLSYIDNYSDFQNDLFNSISIFVLFTALPLGFSIYQMRRFFRALGNLQSEVALQTADLQKAHDEIEQSLATLKSTQSQLIHAEKMASLGELTAGIAHEIQNPLNFVNNFSELNKELIDEQLEEIQKGDVEEVKELALIMKENIAKITHHGKRADDIVKGMLAHSRTNSGEKVLTDLNKLTDEYLRLSYHGLRAKDKSFNADIKTDFDSTLPLINVIPQDIGRVLLNLINNAFQAAAEVEKPLVQVATRKTDKGIEISVSDNGHGIPDNIKDKIFQPFFTTKPTGQGTGLGLSLSYDIMKAHGGKLDLSTSKTGSTFVVHIPL